eukprot:752142-Hanusia_phi.AAC.2
MLDQFFITSTHVDEQQYVNTSDLRCLVPVALSSALTQQRCRSKRPDQQLSNTPQRPLSSMVFPRSRPPLVTLSVRSGSSSHTTWTRRRRGDRRRRSRSAYRFRVALLLRRCEGARDGRGGEDSVALC